MACFRFPFPIGGYIVSANAFTLSKHLCVSWWWYPMRSQHIHAYFFKTVAVRKRMQVSGINYKPGLCSARVPWWPSCGHTGSSPPRDACSWPPSPRQGLGAVIDVMSPPTITLRGILHSGSLGISSVELLHHIHFARLIRLPLKHVRISWLKIVNSLKLIMVGFFFTMCPFWTFFDTGNKIVFVIGQSHHCALFK